jgi:WD40 repeat protein
MFRPLICVSALLGFVLPAQAQRQDDSLPAGALARLGEVRYRHIGRVFSIAFSADSKILLAGTWDGSIRLWDVATGKELRQYPGHKGWVRSVAFSPDGKTFASGGKDKIIRLWETATGKELRRFEGHQHWVQNLAFSPDGKLLASRGGTLRLWDVATGREVRRINPCFGMASLAFSPDGKLLAYGGVNSIVLVNLATDKEVRQFTIPGSSFGGLAFAPNGKMLIGVNSNWDFTIYSWDVTTGKPFRPLGKRQGGMGSIVFAPDGRSMALTGGDYTIRIYEVLTRGERFRLQSPDKKPSTLAYSPDGRILAQGSEDIAVLLWDVTGLWGKDRPRSTAFSEKELQTLWADLGSDDADNAYRAIRRLVAGSKDSVPFIQKHLRPVASVDARTVSRLVADLDSDQFETREQATEQLEKLAELAEPALREALRDKPSLEKRQRIERLLEKLAGERDNPSPHRLRMLRALEALEHMDTPAARRALEELAKGAAGDAFTNKAKEALKRLAKLP